MQKVYLVDKHGGVIFPGERATRQRSWEEAGSITAVVAAGQAPIDVDKRTDALVVALAAAKKVIYEPTDGTVAFEVRVRADGNEDDNLAIEVHAAAGVDHYTKIADLVCTQGTQPGTVGFFCDDIVPSNSDWATARRVIDAQANFIARYVLNTHGHDRFLFVCTNLQNATNIYIEVRRTS